MGLHAAVGACDAGIRSGPLSRLVHLGCGDVCPVLPGKRYYDWAIEDPAGQSPAPIRRIRDDIDTRVLALLTELVDQHPGANA